MFTTHSPSLKQYATTPSRKHNIMQPKPCSTLCLSYNKLFILLQRSRSDLITSVQLPLSRYCSRDLSHSARGDILYLSLYTPKKNVRRKIVSGWFSIARGQTKGEGISEKWYSAQSMCQLSHHTHKPGVIVVFICTFNKLCINHSHYYMTVNKLLSSGVLSVHAEQGMQSALSRLR